MLNAKIRWNMPITFKVASWYQGRLKTESQIIFESYEVGWFLMGMSYVNEN